MIPLPIATGARQALRAALAGCGLSLALLPLDGLAQYPEKPIRMIVAWPPGGGTDVVARVVARHFGERLKQVVVVENRSGASGMVGTEYVARAAPDGYTLQYTVADSHSINPHVFSKIRYDALRDFTPVAVSGSMPNALAVHPSVPARSVAEFVRLAKDRPGRLTFSSWGIGSGGHIRMESFNTYVRIKALHVPYQGSGPGFAALLGGEVDAMMVPFGLAESNHRSGKTRMIAIDTQERFAGMPDIPTFAEQNVPLTFSFWQGVLVPAKVPDAIVAHLNREFTATLLDPQVRRDLLKVGLVAGTTGVNGFGGSPAEVRKYFEAEFVRWGKTIRDANIAPE